MTSTAGQRVAALVLPLLVAGCAAAAGGPARPAAVQPASGCAVVVSGQAGTWARRLVPAFPVGPRQAVSTAVDRLASRRQLVTNGHAVLRTEDGCSWREVWRLPPVRTPALPVASDTDRVLQLLQHPTDPRRAWLVVALGGDVADRVDAGLLLTPAAAERRDGPSTVVLASTDGGRTWSSEGSSVLPGAPGSLRAAPTHPDLLWIPTASGLHHSRDGGRTWALLPAAITLPGGGSRPLDGIASPVLVDVAVDPRTPAVLHGRTNVPVVSQDGGLTWRRRLPDAGAFSGPFVSDEAARAPHLLLAHQVDTTSPVDELILGGGEPVRAPVPAGSLAGVPWSAAWAPGGAELLVATWDRGSSASFPDTGLYAVAADGSLADVDDLDLPPVRTVLADSAGAYHLHTRHELITLERRVDPARGRAQVELDPFGLGDSPPPPPARLETTAGLRVQPGSDGPLRATLRLPARPLPLDVFFLVDVSNSFEPDIDAVAESLAAVVEELTAAGVDLHAGVGELGTREGARYRRHADLARPGTELQRGFERLRTGGGDESHLIALHQTATGAGLTGTTGPSVAPGQAPTWRRGALRTVVVVTDTSYVDEGDADAPRRGEVHRAFAARGVRVLGLEVVREGGDDGMPGAYAAVEAADAAGRTAPTPARADLEQLAAATGALAPRGGVDCRGNGTVEIPEGAPLVCSTTALHLADLHTAGEVLRRVLTAQAAPRELRLRAVSALPVRPATPTGWALPVDVRRARLVRFDGTVVCPVGAGEGPHPVRLVADLAGAPVARARTEVRCGTPPTGEPVGAGPLGSAAATPGPGPGPGAASPSSPVGGPPVPAPALPPPAVAGSGAAAGAAAGASAGASAASGAAAGAPGGAAAAAAAGAPGAAVAERTGEAAPAAAAASVAGAGAAPADQPAVLLLGAAALTGAAAAVARRRQDAPRRTTTSTTTTSTTTTSTTTRRTHP